MMHPHHAADLVHPVTAGVDHDIAVDVAMFGVDRPSVVFVLRQGGDRRVAIDLSPGLARVKSQSLTELGRINVTVERIPKPAQQVLG